MYTHTADTDEETKINRYRDFPLLQSMLREEPEWSMALTVESTYLSRGVSTNDSWMKSVLVFRGRAMEIIFVPWLLITLNALLWTLIIDNFNVEVKNTEAWTTVIPLVLSSCLAFLLVFRLNRIAVRWWETRRMWGVILEQSRILVSGIMTHMNDFPEHRDRAIAWTCAFMISSKLLLRQEKIVPDEELAGILTTEEINRLQKCVNDGQHAALYAASEIRFSIKVGFKITASTPLSYAMAWSSEMARLEKSIALLIANVGGMERIRSTPLPAVYVTHLRTFLFAFLFVMPYIYGHEWGWYTIPSVGLMAYALLGIDGAASECEIPFKKNRANHLAMETYCLAGIKNVLQIMNNFADIRIRESSNGESERENEVPKMKTKKGRENIDEKV